LDCDQYNPDNDALLAQSKQIASGQIGGIVAGVLIFFVLIILLILFLLKKRKTDTSLDNLPKELQEIFSHNNSWEENDGYYYKMVQPGSSIYEFLEFLFYENLGGDKLVIQEAFIIYNTILVSNFANYKRILEKRYISDPALFKKEHWKQSNKSELCTWIVNGYTERVKRFHWNKDDDVPILPAIHGTEGAIAWKICSSGFATLAVLDSGWYGSGIYFTSDARYALPYYGSKKQPTVLIVFLIPGNIYPVTESPNSAKSLCGKPIPAGYQSCYVHTTRVGKVCESRESEFYDEIVVNQETQVIPVFLLSIQAQSIALQLSMWQRDVKEPKTLNTTTNSAT